MEKIVKTEYGDVKIRKMPLSDYAELLKALDNLPKSLISYFKDIDNKQLSKMTNMDYVALLPSILSTSWNDLIAVVAVPTDKDAEFIAKLDFADAVDVVAGILELNNLPRIMAAVKKMLALELNPAQPKI